jgi:cleavage and polyadenylation specificity factor subunit 4
MGDNHTARHGNPQHMAVSGRADGGGFGGAPHRTNAPPLPSRPPLDRHTGALVLQERGGSSATPSAASGGWSKVRAPPSGSARYFLISSSSRATLETAVRHGTWATSHRQNESKLNAAFDTSDNILLFFSVNDSQHFQGVAQMVSRVGDQAAQAAANPQWQGQQGAPHAPTKALRRAFESTRSDARLRPRGHRASAGRNFRLRWLKLVELPFSGTQHLHNPYNEDQPVQVWQHASPSPRLGLPIATSRG